MTKRHNEQPYDYLVKIVIIGDSAVGKTNILLRYVNEEYKMTHISTIGVDFKVKTINVDGVKIKMQIWDTAGQQRFKTMTQTYYKGAAGVVLVYSITDRKTFNNIESWLKQINESQPQNMARIIVGNKSDCGDKDRQVTFEQGKKLAEKYNVQFLQSSAKENTNIQQIFNKMGKLVKGQLQQNEKVGGNNGNGRIKIDGNNNGGKREGGKSCQC